MNTKSINTANLPNFLTERGIGFERLFKDMDQIFQNSTSHGYPPYNIVKLDENDFLIELAVAGFDEDDFDIELHKGILTVSADVGGSDDNTNYIYKGIATRNFERKFTLADTVEVEKVTLHQGMLSIHCKNVIPEELQPKKIEIKTQK